ncbi:MAG: hypothetical protein KDD83_13250 [Caldilineaceae bacterium]|nr:hypothetical protein [Caldilineaceae bacterium]
MVSKLPDQLLVPILTVLLREWQALLAISQRLTATFVKSQPQGIFEVLDYDSTLELLDSKGKKAVFRRRQKVRFLQDHVIAFQDYAWGDGDPLADYKIAPGVEVDRYKEGDRWNLLISLRETKSRGDIEEFHIERSVRNGFTQPTEWRQTEIWLTTHRLRLAIIFPKTRHCTRALLHKRSVDKTVELDGEHIQPLPDGRQIVTWEERHPKRAEIYTIRWEW